MATITLYKEKVNGVGGLIDNLIKSSSNLDVQLGTLKNTLQGVDSSTCNLQDTVDSISSSSKSEKSKIEDLKKLNNKLSEFIETASRKDSLTCLRGPWAARACTASTHCSRWSGPRAWRRARSTATASRAFLPASTLSRPRVGSRRLLPTSMRSLIASLPVCARFRGLSSTVPLTSRRALRLCRST